MNQKIIGALLLVISFSLYIFKPIDFSGLEFILGIIAAIGLGVFLGWFKKK